MFQYNRFISSCHRIVLVAQVNMCPCTLPGTFSQQFKESCVGGLYRPRIAAVSLNQPPESLIWQYPPDNYTAGGVLAKHSTLNPKP